MTLEKFEEAKKLREEIGLLRSIRNSLADNDARLCISNGYDIVIRVNDNIHNGLITNINLMIGSLEGRFENL